MTVPTSPPAQPQPETLVRFAPFLPAIFNEGGPDSFAGRFLRAFELAFGEVQAELDGIPDLFRVRPTPWLRAAADTGTTELELDSAAGLRPGDVLRIGARGQPAEAVVVESVSPDLLPTTVTVSAPLRLGHLPGAPVSMLAPTGRFGTLALSVIPSIMSVVLVSGETLEAEPGDVLQLDPGPLIEHAVVRAVEGGVIHLVQPLTMSHASGQPVSLLRDAATATMPPAFAFAERTGPHYVIRNDVRAGQPWLELDSSSGLAVGDLLQLDDPDPTRVEQVAVLQPPVEPAPPGPGVVRRAVQLALPLQFSHAAGTGLRVHGGPRGGTAFLGWLAGWVAAEARPDRGEAWNRELLRLNARLQPWRGTRRGLEATLNATLRDEATASVGDRPNPLQIGLVATVGVDTVICGDVPGYFTVELRTDPRNGRLASPDGLAELVQAAQAVVRREKPAHTYYDLAIEASTMQIGVDDAREIGVRVGETSLLWESRLLVTGER